MKKDTSIKDMIIIGFALFAMFFGSGNLIFPPYLGRMVGDQYWIGLIGFMIMGVGLPLLGVMATAKVGGDFRVVGNHVSSLFSAILITSLMLTIGPFFAIPRTAATTYEIGIKPFFENINPVAIIGIYFLINTFLVISPISIVDLIGKFLTPILLVTLVTLIVRGSISPLGPVTETTLDNVFADSLIEGYQTMDALAAVCFGGMIVHTIKSKGYNEPKEIITLTLKSSLVAIIGLGIIYGGLMYLGMYTGHMNGTIEKTALVVSLAHQILGETGSVFLAISVSLACLTTSIGLTATGAEYFSDLTKGKLPYWLGAILISIVSMGIALMGVDRIVGITLPVLKILYPVIIVLIGLTFVDQWIASDRVYQIAVYTTLAISLFDVMGQTLGIMPLQKVIRLIPLSSMGFPWVVPVLVVFIVYQLISWNQVKE